MSTNDSSESVSLYLTTLDQFDFSSSPGEPHGAVPHFASDMIWITWEKQRRTYEFAQSLRIRLFRLLYKGPGIFRYPVLAWHTASLIRRYRPRVFMVQNPSIVLALVGVLLKIFFRYSLVVDRHTNFLINKPDSLYKRVFTLVSDFTLKHTDLTVVTNQPLADLVSSKGGNSFVLPDPLPDFPELAPYPLTQQRNICFICTFAGDEPYEAVIAAGRDLSPDIGILITGNAANAKLSIQARETLEECQHVVLTGFLPENQYLDLVGAVDIVMDLTTFDHCLVCGAYEGIAAGKALILSDKEANINLFGDTPIYVGPTSMEIAAGIRQALDEIDMRTEKTRRLEISYRDYWEKAFQNLLDTISSLARK